MTVDGAEPPAGGRSSGAPAAPSRRRRSFRAAIPAVRLVVVLALVVASVMVASVIAVVTGPPSEEDLLKQAGLTGELLIGVKGDQPGVGLLDPKARAFTGFDIDIALMIAADLGYRPSEVRFLSMQSEDRDRMRALDERSGTYRTVDLVVASFSITPARVARGVHFSTPYLSTEQSVLTRRDHPAVEALQDLKNESVCTLATSTSAEALQRAGIVSPKQEKEISSCVAGLLAHKYDAVTTDAAILAGFIHQDENRELLTHWDIGLETREVWGVNVGDNEALRKLVDLSLYHSWHDPDDQRWERAFDENLRPTLSDSPQQDVADDEQPEVDKPDVRQWPWER